MATELFPAMKLFVYICFFLLGVIFGRITMAIEYAFLIERTRKKREEF